MIGYNRAEWIKTVKIKGDNVYLVNNETYVPKAEGNRHYKDIKIWLESNTPEPEFTDEEIVAIELANKKQEAKAYLANTAWYVERLNDPSSGKAIPEEVLAKRAEARLTLDEGAK